MLRFLLDWWRNRRLARKRLLLRYWDGQRQRSIDPWKVWRELYNHPTINLINDAPLVDKGQEPETTNVIDAIAAAFAVHRWDDATQTGLTDWEILNLLAQLDEMLLALKKNTSIGPISSPPTESESSALQEAPATTTS